GVRARADFPTRRSSDLHWLAAVDDAAGLTPQERERARFFARQLVDALSPANFPLTNPQVLKATLQEQGENLLRGFENLLKDLEKDRKSTRLNSSHVKSS